MGSSPLTRGKPPHPRTMDRSGGLIPAHAGKTPALAAKSPKWAAHPRSRGENISGLFIDAAAKGSSPLTRGKPHRAAVGIRRRGLIPAHAGKTGCRRSAPWPPRAHPRSRGENILYGLHNHLSEGSSPLTRGKRWRMCRVMSVLRLIPAHAGKTPA